MIQRTLILFLLLTGKIFAQQDSIIQVDSLAKQKYYTEQTFFVSRNHLVQQVNYNEPQSVDEEFTYRLQIDFTDIDSLREGQTIDVQNAALISCHFEINSVWSWFAETKTQITGTITIVRKTKREIVLRENLRVSDGNKPDLIYAGERVFRKRNQRDPKF